MITKEQFEKIKKLLNNNELINAVHLAREITHLGLRETRDFVRVIETTTWERFAERLGIKEVDDSPMPQSRTSLTEYPVEAKIEYILYNYKQFEDSADTYVRDAIKSSDTDLTILLRRAANHDWNILNGEHFIVVVIKTKAITPDGVIDLCEYRDQIVMEKP